MCTTRAPLLMDAGWASPSLMGQWLLLVCVKPVQRRSRDLGVGCSAWLQSYWPSEGGKSSLRLHVFGHAELLLLCVRTVVVEGVLGSMVAGGTLWQV